MTFKINNTIVVAVVIVVVVVGTYDSPSMFATGRQRRLMNFETRSETVRQ